MNISTRPTFKALFSATILTCALNASAINPQDQYKTYLTRAQKIEPLADFGEQVSLRDGSVHFKSIDIEVPGNGPAIRIIRTSSIDDGRGTDTTSGNGFGREWEFQIPRLKTVTADPPQYIHASQELTPESPIGWQVGGADKNARCSTFGPPPDVEYGPMYVEFMAYDWWFGYQLVDGDGNDQTMFPRSSALPATQYHIGTSNNWVFSCLPATKNGEPGEAFLGIAPDGTKYWFDYLSYTAYDNLCQTFEELGPKGYPMTYCLPRRAASMLVTRVEDRFGNWVTYQYTAGVLTSIDASDGRKVIVDRSAPNTTVTVVGSTGSRTWTYIYDTTYPERLAQVVLPDGSAWVYSGDFGHELYSPHPFEKCSQLYFSEPTGSRQVSITSPSGATATFVFNRRMFGRSYVPKYCSQSSPADPDGGFGQLTKLWVGYALGTKTISGPGVSGQWQYTYSPHNGSWKQDCEAGATCPTTVWTDVTAPDGKRVRSTFSNRWDQTENKLLREDIYTANGDLISTTEFQYATAASTGANPYLWPLLVGSFSGFRVNEEVNLRWTPLMQRKTTQHEKAFVWSIATDCPGTALCFDALARPTKVIKQSLP